MLLRNAFSLSIYVLVLTGLVALAYTEGNPIFFGLTVGGAVLAWLRAERARAPFGRLGMNLGVLACVLLSPADYVLITQDGPLTVAHLLGAVQVVKLFGVKTARDHMQLIVISLIHLGLAAVLTVDLAFSILFLIYMAVAVWTLLLFLVFREIEAKAPAELDTLVVGRGAFGAFSAVTVSTLAITAILFALFPRFSAVLFQVPRRKPAAVSGFSERIGLGDLSSVKLRDEDVMRVTIEDRGDSMPALPLWRGFCYDAYDPARHEWKRHFGQEGAPRSGFIAIRDPEVEGANRRWRLGGSAQPGERPAVYTVLLAPTGTSALFVLPEVVDITFLSGSAAPTSVSADIAGAVEGANMPDSDTRYRVRSVATRAGGSERLREPEATWYGAPRLAEGQPGHDLYRRLGELAAEVTATATDDADRVRALLLYFRSDRFAYSLEDLDAPDDEDPIAHFVFESRRGHCELFASAFVLMARTLGVPARLVSGFQTGEWNELGNYFRVRQLDAHAWAEVHVGGRWVPIDPTPPADDREHGLFAKLEQLIDYLKHRWMNYVISYSLSDQLSAAERVRGRLAGLKRWVTEVGAWLRARLARIDLVAMATLLGALAALGAAVALAIVLLRRLGARRGAHPEDRAAPMRVDFYEDLVAILARLGYERGPAETPRELARKVAAAAAVPTAAASAAVPTSAASATAVPASTSAPGAGQADPDHAARDAFAAVPAIVEAFYDVRFGGHPLPAERLVDIRRALGALGDLAGARRRRGGRGGSVR